MPAETALLVIDVQNTYLQAARPRRRSAAGGAGALRCCGRRSTSACTRQVHPAHGGPARPLPQGGYRCLFARIACHTRDGRERSLSHRRCRAGTTCSCPRTSWPSQIVPELAPLRRRDRGDQDDRQRAHRHAISGCSCTNLGIKNVVCCGVFTDQCVSSTVRSLADESFNVVVVEDCCAAGSDELHHKELEIINMIYCQVMSSGELKAIMGFRLRQARSVLALACNVRCRGVKFGRLRSRRAPRQACQQA